MDYILSNINLLIAIGIFLVMFLCRPVITYIILKIFRLEISPKYLYLKLYKKMSRHCKWGFFYENDYVYLWNKTRSNKNGSFNKGISKT